MEVTPLAEPLPLALLPLANARLTASASLREDPASMTLHSPRDAPVWAQSAHSTLRAAGSLHTAVLRLMLRATGAPPTTTHTSI